MGCLTLVDPSNAPSVAEIESAVQKERLRCVAIVSADRFGEMDNDLRSIADVIESGMSAEAFVAIDTPADNDI